MNTVRFEWDPHKDLLNYEKHGVSFVEAQKAFFDPSRVIAKDLKHSEIEQRFYCFGMLDGAILTVRFTYRSGNIRIFGAAYWREGRERYEKENY